MLKSFKSIISSGLIAGLIIGCASINKNKEIENVLESKAKKVFKYVKINHDSVRRSGSVFQARIELMENKIYEIYVLDYENDNKDELAITELFSGDEEEKITTVRDLDDLGSPNYGQTEIYKCSTDPTNSKTYTTTKLFYDLKDLGVKGEEHRKEYEKAYNEMLDEILEFYEKPN